MTADHRTVAAVVTNAEYGYAILAPLARTVQAPLPVQRIGSDLLPMLIGAALALACGVTANLLSRMIRGRLKD